MALSPTDLLNCRAAVAKVEAAADAADRAVAGMTDLGGSITAWITGSQSTVAAGREDARQTRKGLELVRSKLAALESNPDATHDDALSLIDSCAVYADVSALREAAGLESLTGMVGTVAADTGRDLAAGARELGGNVWSAVKILPFVLVAVVAFVLFGKLGGGRRAA